MAISKKSQKIGEQEFESQYNEATRRAKEIDATELRARSARYNARSKRLSIDLTNGLSFQLPIGLLKEFVGARASDIAAVELAPRGAALHWEKLDLDFSVAGLVTAVLGARAVIAEAGKEGGRARAETTGGRGTLQWRPQRKTAERG
jgi:hypothetical protein